MKYRGTSKIALGLLMILIASLLLSGCGKKVKEPKIEVGGMRFNTQSINSDPDAALIRLTLHKDWRDDEVIEYLLPIDDSGLASANNIPVGYYHALIDVVDHDGKIIYETEEYSYGINIEKGRYNLLEVVLIPAEGGLIITVKIKDEDYLTPPQGKITTTITGRVIGDGEYSVEGHKMILSDYNGFHVEVPIDGNGRFIFEDQALIIAESIVYNLEFRAGTTKESYYSFGHKELTVDLDTPGQLDVGTILVDSNASCFHFTVTADGSSIGEQYIYVMLERKDGNGSSGRGRYTDRNGQIWLPIYANYDSTLAVEIMNSIVFEIEGKFLPRTTYSYEIKL